LPVTGRIFARIYRPRCRWPEAYGIETKSASSLAGQLMYPLRSPPQLDEAQAAMADL
jgi:hypothetical protein